ncbi:hypothetical protein BEP19_03090 [Ammoniphilus oxalaticus]|uniref:Transcriptional regulator n=1 Tax=Ammoniphilus oxalaticus TaxID=66863 RepID=A0A419SNR2_9BACL|nr:hypothetical protein [Ammoniphilus oxalaticus]RKD25928.1 hypothetical protein BEP19_03090 [Ammoniphilus oxalaticus]
MNKERLFEIAQTAIHSSTHDPKHMSISSVRMADLLGDSHEQIEQYLAELVDEGRLRKEKLDKPPHKDIYLLS